MIRATVAAALLLATSHAAAGARQVERTIRTLAGFGTRNTLSAQDDPKRGIGAARDWIYAELQDIAKTSNGRMTVALQSFEVEGGKYPRIPATTRLTNVVATLFGTSDPDRVYVVSGHYDSMCSSPTDAQCDAPGADDDASGVAVVLECARELAPHPLAATVVFVAVVGEEQGLVGSTHFAEEARQNGMNIAGMFTNDIVGHGTDRVRVFGGDTDVPSRELARFIEEVQRKDVPAVNVWMIARKDRYLRSGDHVPFLDRGYPAVRFTEPLENFAHQHQNVRVENGVQYGDLPQFVDFAYVANVARINAASLAALAAAPAPPREVHVVTTELTNDTQLTWSAVRGADHYDIVWRDTLAPQWEHSQRVGNVTTYTLKDVSKDNFFFGVRSVSADGHASPATLVTPPREMTPGSNVALREELGVLARQDQEARKEHAPDMAETDAKRAARLREIVKQYGWPGITLVGFNGMNHAWLIAQHGGRDFLHEMLPLMKRAMEQGELDANLYATSLDRTRIQDGQKQLYGTQFDVKHGGCEPLPIEDPEHVEARRREVGLDPLPEYTKEVCAPYVQH